MGRNSICCDVCKKWIHKKCSGVKGRLQVGRKFQCQVCNGGAYFQLNERQDLKLEDEGTLECVDRFCYLGDVIGAGGGVEEASRNRVRCAWAKFMELSPVLTSRGASQRLKGKIYSACVQSVMIFGSETWVMKVEDMVRLERTKRMMVRWMCGVSLKDRKSNEELRSRLKIECASEVVRHGRLR